MKSPKEAEAMTDQFGLLSRESMSTLMRKLKYAHRLTYDDWQNICMLWFRERGARETVVDILEAAQAGRIKHAGGFNEYDPKFVTWCPENESIVDPDDMPHATPGLTLRMLKEIRRQIGLLQDDLRRDGKDLDVQGHLAALEETQGLSFELLADDVFIRGMDEGQIVVVTGVPGAGKTHFALQHIAAPAIARGWVVVSNVQVVKPPKLENGGQYIYANTLSEALIACIDASLDGKQVILLQDEGGLSREKSRAQTLLNRSQAAVSKVSRKLGFCHVIIYQFEHDVPREVERMASHYYQKPSKEAQDVVFCQTPFLNSQTIDGLPSIHTLKEMGRPILEYRSKDFSPFDVDADFSPLLHYELTRPGLKEDINEREQMMAIRKRLISMREGPQVFKPLDLDQIHREVCEYHLDDPQVGKNRMYKLFRWDLEAACNIRDDQSFYRVLDGWGFASHPDTRVRNDKCRLHGILKADPEWRQRIIAVWEEAEEEEESSTDEPDRPAPPAPTAG